MRERTKVIMGAVTAVWPQETEPREGTNIGNRARATFIPTNLDQGRGDSPPRHHLARHPRHHLARQHSATLGTLIRDLHNDAHNSSSSRRRTQAAFMLSSRYAAHVANPDRHGD